MLVFGLKLDLIAAFVDDFTSLTRMYVETKQICRHFVDGILKCIFFHENVCLNWNFTENRPIDRNSPLV